MAKKSLGAIWIRNIWNYLESQKAEAARLKNEQDFDWYGEGQEAFWQIISGLTIKITPRTKPL